MGFDGDALLENCRWLLMVGGRGRCAYLIECVHGAGCH